MLAVGMIRGQPGVHAFELPKPGIKQPDDVLVRVKEVSPDGTDFNILRYNLQDIASGRNEIALGHEMVGIVEEVGSEVKSLVPGDAVTMTVRRGCGQCQPCLHNQSDMCMTGLFTERGIHKLDGFLTQFVVDQEQYIIKVPPQLVKLAVLTEPLSIVEKGIEQIKANPVFPGPALTRSIASSLRTGVGAKQPWWLMQVLLGSWLQHYSDWLG